MGEWVSDRLVIAPKTLTAKPKDISILAAILCRYADYKALDVSSRADLSKFGDSDTISGNAKEALSWVNASGIINGKSGSILSLSGKATGAETAVMLERLAALVSSGDPQ